METARKRFKLAADAEQHIRKEALEDLRFYAGEQWPDNIVSDRNLTNRPILTINRLPQFAQQVINEQRASRPSIQVNPVGDGADVETAEIIQGLMRHIEINSDAEVAYDTAFEHAVIHGFGYFLLTTEYCDDESTDQDIVIEEIEDPFSIYYDPTCKKPDFADAEFAFRISEIPVDKYKEDYPDSHVASLADFRSIGDAERDWFSADGVRVAEYWHIEKKPRTMVRLTSGRMVDDSKLKDDDQIELRNGKPITRKSVTRTCVWTKMNAREVLDERVIPGKSVPVIPVLGGKLIVNGRKKLVGIVRHAKDAQRMFNYARSGVVEQIALASKAPWIMAEGQDEDHEQEWKLANVKNYSRLVYKPTEIGGTPVGPPIRNTWEPPIQALTQSLAQSDQDLKSTTGIFDPSLGERTTGQSGVAINALQRQGERANAHLLDNMTRSVRRAGKVALEMIPTVYDVPRVLRIVNPDQSHRMVTINEQFMLEGVARIYDLTVGRYDVTISTGPSYNSRRQEFVQSVLSLVQAAPETMAFVMDLLVRNMDWPGAAEIADRLKKMLPQQLQDPEKNADGSAGPPPLPAAIQAQIQQMMQQNAMLVQELQKVSQTLESKRLDIESKERIAGQTNEVALVIADLKTQSTQSLAMMREEFASIADRLQHMNVGQSIEQDAMNSEADRQQQTDLAAADQQHQAGQGEADRQHQAAQSELDRQHQVAQATAAQAAALKAAAARPKPMPGNPKPAARKPPAKAA